LTLNFPLYALIAVCTAVLLEYESLKNNENVGALAFIAEIAG